MQRGRAFGILLAVFFNRIFLFISFFPLLISTLTGDPDLKNGGFWLNEHTHVPASSSCSHLGRTMMNERHRSSPNEVRKQGYKLWVQEQKTKLRASPGWTLLVM